MFDAKLENGLQMKKIISALTALVENAVWDLTEDGISLQSMDASHVALVEMNLKFENFEYYRLDEKTHMGLNLLNLNKIFGAFSGGNVTMQSDSDGDIVKFIFEDEKSQKTQNFELRLMDIDVEPLGIPEQEYEATFTMPSNEFTKIVKDLLVIGDAVTIAVTKGDVMFKVEGDIGKADIVIKKDEKLSERKKKRKTKKKNKKKNVKKENDDEEMEEEVAVESESEEESSDNNSDSEPNMLELKVKEKIELQFAAAYLKKFCAAAPLSKTVSVSLSKDVPMVICYEIEDLGHIKYFLAPKIDDDDDED